MNSPSQTLAERIVNRLLQEKLLSESEAKKILPKLADGKVQSEDWHVAIQMGLSSKTKP